ECLMGIEAGVREILTAFDRGEVANFRDPRYSNVQWIEPRHQEKQGRPGEPPAIELTALRFARKSRWWRSVVLGASGASLLQDPATELLNLARMVEPARVS